MLQLLDRLITDEDLENYYNDIERLQTDQCVFKFLKYLAANFISPQHFWGSLDILCQTWTFRLSNYAYHVLMLYKITDEVILC